MGPCEGVVWIEIFILSALGAAGGFKQLSATRMERRFGCKAQRNPGGLPSGGQTGSWGNVSAADGDGDNWSREKGVCAGPQAEGRGEAPCVKGKEELIS